MININEIAFTYPKQPLLPFTIFKSRITAFKNVDNFWIIPENLLSIRVNCWNIEELENLYPEALFPRRPVAVYTSIGWVRGEVKIKNYESLLILLVDYGEEFYIPIPAFGRIKGIKPLPLICATRPPLVYNCMMDEAGKEEMERLARLGIPPSSIFRVRDGLEAVIVYPFDEEKRNPYQICIIKRNGITLADI